MSDYECWLVSFLGPDGCVMKVAVRIPHERLTEDQRTNYMEPENREALRLLFQDHDYDYGPVVDIEPIANVVVLHAKP